MVKNYRSIGSLSAPGGSMITQRFRLLLSATIAAVGVLMWSPAAFSISDAELEAQAARAFADQKAASPLTTDRAIIDYVSCVANAVVAVLDPPFSDLRWEMAILESDQIQASAMPGGKILVYEGILKAARNQDQLAAVIGHEIAHVTAEHSKKRASKGVMSNLGVKVAAVLIGGGNQGATYTAQQALSQGAIYGFFLPFSRKHETEADVIGLEYMARAGFDPRAAVPLWQNMAAEGGDGPPEFLSTHPSDEKRIDALISQWSKVLPLYNEALEAGRSPNCVAPELPEKSEKE
jgi:predicted Zn-dependent protease